MKLQPISLTGQRARLIPLRLDHSEALMEAARSPEIWRYLPDWVQDAAQMKCWVQTALKQQDSGIELPFAIIDGDTGKIVGSTRLTNSVAAHRQIEIGWTWLSPDVWRTRINTECKFLLLRHCFEELDLLRVQLKTDARNERSQRAIERIGGVREGILRHHRVLPDGFIRDTVMYSIIAPEWPRVREHLQSLLDGYDEAER